jgi:molybdopterin molybdotransferase
MLPGDTTAPGPQAAGRKKMLSVDEAQSMLLARARPCAGVEIVPTERAVGRVLAESQDSRVDVPPADNSAMDGYAVAADDLAPDGPTRMTVSQRIPAGAAGSPLLPGSAARIFTGAPIPPGADTVVIQENCEADGDQVLIRTPAQRGENVRRAGEAVRAGDSVLEAGTRLTPQHLGMAASVGIDRLPVFRPLRVAIFSTGNELVMPGTPLGPGQIYNSNRYTLSALVQRLGMEVVDLGIIADELEATRDVLRRASAQADAIITSGGVSVGEEDYVKTALEETGEMMMWKVAIKPGKPIAYGEVDGIPFLGLPGNPVSVFVTFCLLVKPFLLRRQGAHHEPPAALPAVADFEWSRSGPRREFLRVRVRRGGDGALHAELFPNQGSGVLTSVVWADGLAIAPEHTVVQPGDTVDYYPYAVLLD